MIYYGITLLMILVIIVYRKILSAFDIIWNYLIRVLSLLLFLLFSNDNILKFLERLDYIEDLMAGLIDGNLMMNITMILVVVNAWIIVWIVIYSLRIVQHINNRRKKRDIT